VALCNKRMNNGVYANKCKLCDSFVLFFYTSWNAVTCCRACEVTLLFVDTSIALTYLLVCRQRVVVGHWLTGARAAAAGGDAWLQ